MDRIEQTYIMDAPVEQVWAALTDPEFIRQWSGADADFPLEVDAEYSLWDGSISGRIVEIVPQQRLVQTWQPQDWEREDSVVTFTLTPQDGGTRVDLVHENVEEGDYEGTNEGWDIYYLGAIKKMLGAPAPKRAPAKKAAAKKATAKKAVTKKSAAKKKTTAKKTAKRAPAKKKTAARKK